MDSAFWGLLVLLVLVITAYEHIRREFVIEVRAKTTQIGKLKLLVRNLENLSERLTTTNQHLDADLHEAEAIIRAVRMGRKLRRGRYILHTKNLIPENVPEHEKGGS